VMGAMRLLVLCFLLVGCSALPRAPKELYALNRALTHDDCKAHVRAVALMSGYPTKALITCRNSDTKLCHASALVETENGQFVLDNGSLGTDARVLSYKEFLTWIKWNRDSVRYGVFPLEILDQSKS